MKNSSGLGTLEFGIVIVVFLILMTGLFDVVNIFRGTSAAKQAATLGAEHLARLDKELPEVERMNEASRLAAGELRAAFPNLRVNCHDSSEPLCWKVDLNLVGGEAHAEVTISLPLMILPDSPRILRAFSESRLENAFLPDHRPKLNNTYVDDPPPD